MMETSELIQQIQVVSSSREVKAKASEAVKSSREAWEEANKSLIAGVVAANIILDTDEARLRDMTIEVYNATGEKKPAPGVAIRELTKLTYDPLAALSWATEHKIALSLDKRAFEGIAKQSPLDFVASTIEIQATIATELPAEQPKPSMSEDILHAEREQYPEE